MVPEITLSAWQPPDLTITVSHWNDREANSFNSREVRFPRRRATEIREALAQF